MDTEADYRDYLEAEIDRSPSMEKCGMCGREFAAIFYYDTRLDDWFWDSYCSEECEEIMGQIDLYEEQQLKLADARMVQWTYWGEVTI